MRSNYTPALRERVEEHPMRARLMVEAHAEIQAHIRQREDQWDEADVDPDANGFDFLPDGGLVLDASSLGTVLEQTTTDATTHTNLNRPPGGGEYDVVRIDWLGSQPSDLEVLRVTLKLDPDTGSGQQVVTWRCQLMALTRQSGEEGTELTYYELTPLSEPVETTAGGSAGDVVFDFSTILPQPLNWHPEGDGAPPTPVTYVFVWGVKSDGSLAANTGLLAGGGSLTTGSPIGVSGVTLGDSSQQAGAYDLGSVIDTPRIVIEAGSYSDATITWTTNPFLLGDGLFGTDTFADTNGTAPASHTPDLGYGGWTELRHNDTGTYTLDIQSNKLSFLCGTAGAEKRFVLVSDNAMIPATGSWEFRTTWTRDATATGSHKGGLSFYLHTTGVFTGTLGWPAGVHVWLEEQDANNVRYRLFEGDANGDSVQQISDATDIALSGAASIDLGVTVNGASVIIWTEPAGGGTRTTHGTKILSTDFLALGYQRVGPSGASASAANPTQTWNDLQFTLSAGATVEFTLYGETPEGTALTGEVRNDADTAWVAFTDGQTTEDLTGVSDRSSYDIRATLATNAAGNLTPVLRAIGIRQISILDVSDTAEVMTRGLGFSLPTLEGQPENVTIKILRDGIRDWEDFASRIASEFTVSEIYFRVFIGADDLTRSQWMVRWEGVVLDQHGEAGALVFDCVCPLALLDAQLPKAVETSPGTWEWQHPNWNPASYKTIYEELLDTWGELPLRHRGPGVTSTTSVTRTIGRGEVRESAAQIARTQGMTMFSSQGRVVARDVFAKGGIKAFFSLEEITQGAVTPGYQQRIPRYVVPYNYDEERGEFDDIVVRTHGSSLLAFRRVPLKPEDRANDDFAKWIQDSTTATNVAQRVVDTQGTGMVTVPIHSSVAHPELEPGDRVAVITDRLALKDPNDATRQLKGELACVGVVMEANDVWGRDLVVWVQDLNDIVSASATGLSDGEDLTYTLKVQFSQFTNIISGAADFSNNDLRSTSTSALTAWAVIQVPAFVKKVRRTRCRSYVGAGGESTSVSVDVRKSVDGTDTLIGNVVDSDTRGSWATTAWDTSPAGDIEAGAALFLFATVDPDHLTTPAAADARLLWVEVEFA